MIAESIPLEQKIAKLEANFENLSVSDRVFAESLLKQFIEKGTLSYKQTYWVDKLAGQKKPEPVYLDGNLTPLITMLKHAGQHIKRPGILMSMPNGETIHVKQASEKSKNKGQFYVTAGPTWGAAYYGRINLSGEFVASYGANGVTDLAAVVAALKVFVADPVKAATEYGKSTGHCCFCGLGLTDEKSTEVGYGPVCAKHFGLPWGKV